ncbi:hypothetical protein V6N12_066258 [Hibiscus sabdariffa]|uniref:peptidylprolyl isomerase n=1 Tax=Hibiscus sabdariffa TaxID=183260 RepID=A0ABR2AS12_9ROSI
MSMGTNGNSKPGKRTSMPMILSTPLLSEPSFISCSRVGIFSTPRKKNAIFCLKDDGASVHRKENLRRRLLLFVLVSSGLSPTLASYGKTKSKNPYDEKRLLEQNKRRQKENNAPEDFPNFIREGFEVKVVTSEDYKKSDSGLIYRDYEVGKGDCPKAGQQVTFHYIGYNESGRRIDSTYIQGAPARIRMGTNAVVPGFEEGIRDMRPGGKRRIIIPPELGPPVGPSTFFSSKQFEVFDIELLGIQNCQRRTIAFYSDVATANLSVNVNVAKVVAEEGEMNLLVDTPRSMNMMVAEEAAGGLLNLSERNAGALANLAADDKCSMEVAIAGGVHVLVMLSLSCMHGFQQTSLMFHSVPLVVLVTLAQSCSNASPGLQARAAGALWGLSMSEANSIAIGQKGVASLIALVHTDAEDVHETAAGNLWNHAFNHVEQNEFAPMGTPSESSSKNFTIPSGRQAVPHASLMQAAGAAAANAPFEAKIFAGIVL